MEEKGTRQHLQSPLLIALLPAWSQITGLEMPESGLYLLANLPSPQIHTSKPPSYHLLVNFVAMKKDTALLAKSESRSLSVGLPPSLLCQRLVTELCPDMEGFRAMLKL